MSWGARRILTPRERRRVVALRRNYRSIQDITSALSVSKNKVCDCIACDMPADEVAAIIKHMAQRNRRQAKPPKPEAFDPTPYLTGQKWPALPEMEEEE